MKIRFEPTGAEVDVDPNKSLLQLCQAQKIEIRSICKGVRAVPSAGVHITAGQNNILPPTQAELQLIGSSYYLDGRRLSCQVRCFGPVTVDLSEQLSKADQPNKKIRGYRPTQERESKATTGTLVLQEKPTKR